MFAADLRAVDEGLAARVDRSNGSADIPQPRMSPPRRRARRAAVASLLVVAFAIGGWLARDIVRTWSRRVVAPAPKPVLVVAPFTPQDPSRDYVAAGFAADVAASLGQVPGLQVVGRDAAADLSGASAAELARRAGAGAILSGTIDTPGTRMHAVLKLTDQASGDLLWQDEYEREVNEVFPLRRQITVDVAQAMGLRVGPTAAAEREAARLVDAAAYDAYLRGQAAVRDGRFETAADSFAAALKLDDGLAEAHAAYAGALYRRAPADATAADANRPLIDRAAARAMELAPDLPAANLAAALAAHTFADAMAALKAAIRYDRSYTAAYRELASEIDDIDPERARRIRERAAMLDGRERVEDVAADAETADACATLVATPNAGDRRAIAAARQRLAAAVDRGGRRDAGPSVARCAVLAAAALGQAAAAGTLLERIASDPAAFRVWVANARGVSRLRRLRETVFPWARVNGEPSFVRACDALEQSYERARAEIASVLQDVQF
jgi:TolB-like protein